jgi:hypothetical protein
VAVPTLSRRIAKSFAAWESRGRGWQVADYLVALEPPFRAFALLPGADSGPQPLDDAVRPTFLSLLAQKAQAALSGAPAEPMPEVFSFEEQEPFPTPPRGNIATRRLLIDANSAFSTDVVLAVVRALAEGRHPVAFELIGHGGVVTVQIACDEANAAHVLRSVEAYLPEVALLDDGDDLRAAWNPNLPSLVVDYGYAEEFFLPLASPKGLRIDPYISLISALAHVQAGETLCYQVLFTSTINPWRTAILDAVTAPDGRALFVDAPEFIPSAREKTASPLLAVVVRMGVCAESYERILALICSTNAFFTQFARPGGNRLVPLSNDHYSDVAHVVAFLARVSFRTGMILSADELVGLVHPPDRLVSTDALVRLHQRTKAVPASAKGQPFALGDNVHRGVRETVTLGVRERLAHLLLTGASGTGKSTLLVNLIRQDMEQGHGVAVLDPHGDLITDVLKFVPEHRRGDVVVFDPSDEVRPVGFNILNAMSEREKILLSSDLTGIFQRLSTSWGDTMSTVLANAVLAILESKDGGTLLHLRRFLVDDGYRKTFLQTISDPEVRFFWSKEWPLIGTRSIGPLLSRLNAFLRPKLIRQIVGQKTPKLRFGTLMDERKIFLAKLSQGLIGNENAYLLGSLLLSRLLQCALARQEIDREKRAPFFVHVDEAGHFLTPSLASFLTESRKYGCGITLAAQTVAQIRAVPQVATAVLGNCHTRIVFRVGDDDARTLADGFSFFEAQDLKSLGTGEAIARIGEATSDCNLKTHAAPLVDAAVANSRRADIIARSREQFGADSAQIEKEFGELRQTLEEPVAPVAQPAKEPWISVEVPPRQAAPTPAPMPPTAPPETKPRAWPAPASEPSPLGRGGEEHKYLQHLIKRLAEERGFRAVIEEVVDGGQVDVALRRDDIAIACEVSVTTSTDHELDNIRKCVSAGFAQVWLVVPDKKRRDKLAKVAAELGQAVRYLAGEDLVPAFESLAPAPATRERVVGGYKVKATRRATSYEDYEKRQAAIAEVIARSILKRRKKE